MIEKVRNLYFNRYELVEELSVLRAKARLSLEEVACEIGISRQTYKRIIV